MIDQFIKGIGYYPKAHRVMMENRLMKFILIPGFMSLFYIIGFVLLAYFFADSLSSYLYPEWLDSLTNSWWLSWAKSFIISSVKFILTFIAWLILLVIGLFTYKFVILILFAPVWGYVSEVVEKALNGEKAPDFSFKGMIKDILRSLKLNIRNTLSLILVYAISVLIGFIPVIGPFISFAVIIIYQSYYEGVGLSDYTLERKRYSVEETISFTKKNKYGIMGIGCGFTLILLIPFLGWFTAPGYGTVAATIATLEKTEKN